jgi:hypothetical protein
MMNSLRKRLSWLLFFLGCYIVVDGFGSILVYLYQPFVFDHFMRVIRMLVGITVCYIALKMKDTSEEKIGEDDV